jgi:hypothetical protein
MKALGWFFGVVCIFFGFGFLSISWFLGGAFMLSGLIFIPYTRNKFFAKIDSGNLKDHINKQESMGFNKSAKFYNGSGGMESINPKLKKPQRIKHQRGLDLNTVKFKYEDYEGNVTERTVDFHSGKRDGIFKGFCHLRKENRTFYYSRIAGTEVVNVNTGEVMTPMEWRYSIQGTKVAEVAMKDEKEQREREKELAKAYDTWMRLVEPAPVVNFKGKKFALGGYFQSGDIDTSKDKVISRGGIIQVTPNGKSDYIVINNTRAVSQTFEKAIKKIIGRGITPMIISEEHWLDAMK